MFHNGDDEATHSDGRKKSTGSPGGRERQVNVVDEFPKADANNSSHL